MKQSQKLLLTWLIEDTRLFGTIKNLISADDFTEELYHRVAEQLFTQYGESGTVNPAQIISTFLEEEEQREVAGLFNARIHDVETKAEKEKALKETIIRVKQNSIEHRSKNMDPTDLSALMKVVEDKRTLEQLEKLHISID
jgi:DNA primase